MGVRDPGEIIQSHLPVGFFFVVVVFFVVVSPVPFFIKGTVHKMKTLA